jgi:hypothetical protein
MVIFWEKALLGKTIPEMLGWEECGGWFLDWIAGEKKNQEKSFGGTKPSQ